MTGLRLVCATANPGKRAEIAAVLGDRVELLARPDVGDIVEDTGTLEGNARTKAATIAAATGLPAVADDTGLFIDALGGAPGVDTADWAGPGASAEANRAVALAALAGVPEGARTARFVTVAIVVWPDGREVLAVGECAGTLAAAERGGRGWGYDPLFVPAEGDGRTFAEMDAADKERLSHRGRAFRALAAALGLDR
ncbi:MAG: non-canonical purine NTP pyrophosphatase [Acidimicrobiales bacterium]